jgi:hypothetical protein
MGSGQSQAEQVDRRHNSCRGQIGLTYCTRPRLSIEAEEGDTMMGQSRSMTQEEAARERGSRP